MRNDFESNYLAHHGILGMKWGVRRYQNPDGSLTDAGRERYGVSAGSVESIGSEKGIKRRTKDLKKAIKKNEKKRAKEYTKIANNPENFLGLNKKHAKKIEEYSENIRKGEKEIERLMVKYNTLTDEEVLAAKKKARDYDNIGSEKWDDYTSRKNWDDYYATWNKKRDELESKSQAYKDYYAEKAQKREAKLTDGADIESKAHAAAKKAGLDQGDNWKVYRDAQAGDKKAQEIVKKWEADKVKDKKQKGSF